MDEYRRYHEAFKKSLEDGFKPPIDANSDLPPYRTVKAHALSSTHHVGALDGSDQQLFAVEGNANAGIAIWATLYVEYDLHHPEKEFYREGPGSEPWTQNDYYYYQLTIRYPHSQEEKNRKLRNDYHALRQILSAARATDPPLLAVEKGPQDANVREEAAKQRANGEWRAFQRAAIDQLARHDLLLRDGRFNCQIEQSASWVDQVGRLSSRNQVRTVGVVKAGNMYEELYPYIKAIAGKTLFPFYFLIPNELIEQSYHNEAYPIRKTLMLGGRDHTDLAGIGGAWVAFCPEPYEPQAFVILEFNVYDLYNYKPLTGQVMTLHDWHKRFLHGPMHGNNVYVTDILLHKDYDIEKLIEPTVCEILWLCEQEIGRFAYPNLLGVAHHDVVLTKRKADLLRKRYKEILIDSDILLENLISFNFTENPHKLHNIH